MFRITCAMAFLFIVALPLRGAEEAKPNTLTPKEVELGWILLFDGETTFGLRIDGEASVKDGILTIGGEKAAHVETTTGFGYGGVEMECRWKGKKQPDIIYPCLGKLSAVNELDKGLRSLEKGEWNNHKVALAVVKKENKNEAEATFIYSNISPSAGVGQTLKLDLKTNRKLHDLKASPLGFLVPADTTLELRSMRFLPMPLPIFNGKDLTGWKKFDADPKKAKSEFTVAKEGWIHLKDGPGDLQTEKEWGDFILQIECFSSGDKLNSGVFFRCRPNEYQNGYEAQIHNGFTEKAEKEYAIEVFDPETHKLSATKKEKYQAMDYGTGGIYRRMPARRPVAKDKEWFTMTVAAQGRHIATWVNGIQTVDWTDNRPEADNARNGCKLGKGPISLQGHDATTDLRFRHINIVDLPTGEKKEK